MIVILNFLHHICDIEKVEAFRQSHHFDDVEEVLPFSVQALELQRNQRYEIINKVGPQIPLHSFAWVFNWELLSLNLILQQPLCYHVDKENTFATDDCVEF